MQLTERHVIRNGSKMYAEADRVCFLSKNLYNAALFVVRQKYFDNGEWLRYAFLQHVFSEDGNPDFRALPAKVAQATMRRVDDNMKAFFRSAKEFSKTPEKFTGRPKMPKYLDKKNGRFVTEYTKQAVSKKALDAEGVIVPSGTSIRIKSKVCFSDLNCVRIVPSNGVYVVEVVYTVPDRRERADNGRYAAIDLGVSNFATVASNCDDVRPYIVSGMEIKSYNHWYNKRKAFLQSAAEKRNDTKRTKALARMERDRNNRVSDFMHKASRRIVNQLVSDRMTLLVIGYNEGWKQDIDNGRANNQNFCYIPYLKFVEMLEYKCRLAGIRCVRVNESHTSKCSFLDMEDVCHHDVYAGKRVKRGLFMASDGRTINADVNGALNILRKCKPIGDIGIPVWCNGCVVHPAIIHVWTMAKSAGDSVAGGGLSSGSFGRRPCSKRQRVRAVSLF